MVNGTQFGTTQGVVTGGTTYSFSGSAFNIPAGQTVNVDVYADTLSLRRVVFIPATALIGYSGIWRDLVHFDHLQLVRRTWSDSQLQRSARFDDCCRFEQSSGRSDRPELHWQHARGLPLYGNLER